MFCGKCGYKNEDGAVICAQCGEKMNSEYASVANDTDAAKKVSKRNKLVGIVAIALAALIFLGALTAILVNIFYRSPAKTARQMVKYICEADAKKLAGLLPDAYFEDMEEDSDNDYNKRDFIDDLDENLADMQEYYEERDKKWDYSCEIRDVYDLDKEKLSELEDRYEDEYDIEIKNAKKVKVKLTMTFDGESQRETIIMIVVKIGGTWYMDVESFNSVIG